MLDVFHCCPFFFFNCVSFFSWFCWRGPLCWAAVMSHSLCVWATPLGKRKPHWGLPSKAGMGNWPHMRPRDHTLCMWLIGLLIDFFFFFLIIWWIVDEHSTILSPPFFFFLARQPFQLRKKMTVYGYFIVCVNPVEIGERIVYPCIEKYIIQNWGYEKHVHFCHTSSLEVPLRK